MNFLSVQNNFNKPHNNNSFFFPEAHSRNNFVTDSQAQISENNNQLSPNYQEKTIQEVWSKHNFNNLSKNKTESMVSLSNVKMCWAEQKSEEKVEENKEEVDLKPEIEVKEEVKKESEDIEEEIEQTVNNKEESPSHHARRPPNAFLIFCKKHRPIVRERFPNLENRGVTKILGEWWALLTNSEKQPYNDLAKEYKDAFLSANPNFRWYKLPAPPLRTLTTRPMTISKVSAPLSSPNNILTSEFTPGKLADESQLGGLTSLMNNFSQTPKQEVLDNIVLNMTGEKSLDSSIVSPVNNIQVSTPPKPIKKRFVEFYNEGKHGVRNILQEDEDVDEKQDIPQSDQEEPENMTKQDLMNKVVDDMFAKNQYDLSEKNGLREVRKSERVCKGKRYEMFMLQGKLLGNKREAKWINQRQNNNKIVTKIDNEFNTINNNNNIDIKKPETPKLDLSDTIKRLAERTNVKLDFDSQTIVEKELLTDQSQPKRVRSISENSDSSGKNSQTNFNLDLRISNLPCLGYDEFLQRKRESKKRKVKSKTDGDIKNKIQKFDSSDTQLVGSKKRKNKQSITHLEKKEENLINDLLGLETLAEVAANTQKINEKSQNFNF